MTKRFKTVKASIVTGLILVSVIVAVLPTASAGLIFNLQSVVTVGWVGEQTKQPVIPRGELRVLTLNITYYVTRGFFGAGMLSVYDGRAVVITIEIVETPSWCTANIAQGTITGTVKANGKDYSTTTLTLQVADDAPAYGLGSIKVKAKVATAGLIQGYENIFTLSFIPDYKPLIKPSLPETNTKEIGPLDVATFPITIENLGNARTIVYLSINNTSLPKDWVAIVTDQVTLEEGSGSTGTAYLVIKPPKGFGYHLDEEKITVTLQPIKADDATKKGEPVYITVLVQSRGFSTPGFEAITLIGAFAILFIFMTYIRKKKK
jgi:hypothetical protein